MTTCSDNFFYKLNEGDTTSSGIKTGLNSKGENASCTKKFNVTSSLLDEYADTSTEMSDYMNEH